MAGRSAFFASPPNKVSALEVQIPSLHPDLRGEYDRISDTSGCPSQARPHSGTASSEVSSASKQHRNKKKKQRLTLQQTTRALNLGRFAYNAGAGGLLPAPAPGSKTTTTRGGQKKVAAAANGTGSSKKKPRAQARKEEALRARSAFARAVQHHRAKRGGKD
ncbi:a46e51a3-e6b5-433c-99e9-9070c092a8c6 [Thermothielavioides terrestris]|uniref:Uncharacterized protein n=2 Tax=Thermothielavioides terrestris TaxID=2587410 RepID=G2RA44_THETT|nr:uncharacterized protein THITE_2120299 [Thermothielavioides terrestris NRRL 8126]AEO69632.1 hypothetical protein THITE_2120299 [Thermothielavioides terrestris NRRL 8126]SPQ26151.1 a46e51a3-e6b5-433c-99e9-9070c092a8c6 [Thermothielavioides terrestris]